MENKELLYNLNDETRHYLDDAFSYLDYFINGKKVSKDELEDYISYSFLLSTLKNQSIFKDIFDEYDINYERISSMLIDSDVSFKKAEDTEFLKHNNLKQFIQNIYARLRYNNYLEETNILLTELQPYQIFDFVTENYFYGIDTVLKRINIDFVDELVPKLCKRTHDYDSHFANEHGVNVEEEEKRESESDDSFDFDYCKIILSDDDSAYIVFKNGFNFNTSIVSGMHNNRNLKNDQFIQVIDFNKRYKIKKLSGFTKLNKENLQKIFDNKNTIDQVTISFGDISSNESFIITFDSKHAFADMFEENKQIVKDIMRIGDLEPKEEKKIISSPTPALDTYGFDLTKDRYLKDPSVGRDSKIRELEKILLYPEKDKSIIITGTAGCGKTALVKGLAYRVQNGDVPEDLKNLRIISIDCATLVADTKYVGSLEKKMKSILEEASSSKDIIIFMDEIHQALGAGKSEGNNNTVSEILKPYLDYGRARLIGATTDREYNEYIANDGAFKTRFKKITLDEPTHDIIYQVLEDLIISYNKFSYSKLNVSDEERDMIINTLINATSEKHRSYNDRASNPRLVLDIIKDAYALAALDSRTEVTLNDIAQALMEEERLYMSARESYAKIFRNLKPQPVRDNLISFENALKLIKK